MNTLKLQNDESLMESQCDLEGFIFTTADEEAIHGAVEKQMRGLNVSPQEQE